MGCGELEGSRGQGGEQGAGGGWAVGELEGSRGLGGQLGGGDGWAAGERVGAWAGDRDRTGHAHRWPLGARGVARDPQPACLPGCSWQPPHPPHHPPNQPIRCPASSAHPCLLPWTRTGPPPWPHTGKPHLPKASASHWANLPLLQWTRTGPPPGPRSRPRCPPPGPRSQQGCCRGVGADSTLHLKI